MRAFLVYFKEFKKTSEKINIIVNPKQMEENDKILKITIVYEVLRYSAKQKSFNFLVSDLKN